jgi:hypothetical protein
VNLLFQAAMNDVPERRFSFVIVDKGQGVFYTDKSIHMITELMPLDKRIKLL